MLFYARTSSPGISPTIENPPRIPRYPGRQVNRRGDVSDIDDISPGSCQPRNNPAETKTLGADSAEQHAEYMKFAE